MKDIYVTKPFLPPLEEYNSYIENIWKSEQLTNQGVYVQELENKLSSSLSVPYVHFLSSGTMALQLAVTALNIEGAEIITTPFSYVATLSSILWQKCKPVFVDIEANNFTIDVKQIEQAITKSTRAILAVHVFGYACNIDAISEIAKKHSLYTIYDAAHTFGARYKGKSLLSYGDISIASFHATKLFHTAEGGACFTHNKMLSDRIDLQKRFGHYGDSHYCLGINGKNSELHAALGLANLPYVEQNIAQRKKIVELYDKELATILIRPCMQEGYNYAYYPVVFESEQVLLRVFEKLKEERIFPRRYFYPSLNTLNYVEYTPCPHSESISCRIACLPLYNGLSYDDVLRICAIIKNCL